MKIQILFLCLFICIPIFAQQDNAPFPIQQGDRWGYIDRSGKIVIEPRFKIAEEFSEGLAAVQLNGRWGFIDTSGKIVVEPQYSWANRFSEGLARVQVGAERYGKWGFIDRTGQMVIAPQFQQDIGGSDGTYDFHEGLAVIEVGSRKGFIDKAGNIVISPRFEYVYPFSKGVAKVTESLAGKWAYIDKTGASAIAPPDESEAKPGTLYYSEGLAILDKDNQYGFVDQTGKTVIEPQFYFANDFHNGLAKVGLTQQVWGYIDKTGQVVWQQNAPPAADERVSRFLQLGHYQELHSLGWSPNGTILTSYSSVDEWLMVWNVQSGQLLWQMKAALLKPETPVKSPAGTFIATGEKDFELRDAETGKVIWTAKTRSATPERVTSPDGSMIAERGTYGDASVRIYDSHTRQLIRRLEGHPGVILSIAFAPDGKLIASAGRDRVIRFWDAQTGAVVKSLSGHTQEITSIAFSGDGKRLVSGSPDDTIKIWNVEDGTLIRSFMAHGSFPEGVASVTLSHDGRTIISAVREQIKLWETATGKQIGSLISGEREVRTLMFSPDDKLVVSGYDDSTIKLWDVKRNRLRRVIKGRFEDLRATVFSPDGRFIAAGYSSSDCRVEVWSVQSGRLVMQLGKDSDYVESIAFSRDGNMIATGHFWDDVRVWNAKTGKLLKSFKQPFSENDRVAFSPDGKYVVSGGWNQNVVLWNVPQGKVAWSVLPLDWETEKQLTEVYRKDGAVAAAAKAEEERRTVAADKEIASWKQPVTITFEHFGEAENPLDQHMGETGAVETSLIRKSAAEASGVWLRLRNNSPLPISFRTNSMYLPRQGCNGGMCDGAEVSIQYQIEEANGKAVPYGSDMAFVSVLPPGASVLFSVAKVHLQNRRTVFISYRYLKENEKHQLKEYGTDKRVNFRCSAKSC